MGGVKVTLGQLLLTYVGSSQSKLLLHKAKGPLFVGFSF